MKDDSGHPLGGIVRVDPEEWKKYIPINEFISETDERDIGLEYRILRYMTETEKPTSKPERRAGNKDRYRDIIPFNSTRCRTSNNEEDNTYINASYMSDGTDTPPEQCFIAAQGPLLTSVDDFWATVTLHGVTLIFALCQLEEAGKLKCYQYWPSRNETLLLKNGNTVRLKSEIPMKKYGGGVTTLGTKQRLGLDDGHDLDLIRRELTVSSPSGATIQVLTQFHYLSWPDHGTPEPDQVNRLFKVFHSERSKQHLSIEGHKRPILVHCSAGVGRTGCIIALERIAYRIRLQKESGETPTIGVLDTLLDMRRYRAFMIQTTGQYQLVYDTLRTLIAENFFEQDPILPDET